MKNQAFKSLPTKKLPKGDREQAVLLGLVELYLKTGKPIGSQTLQENGFKSLSSATIRNYFSKMEKTGYLKQPHTSGGRIPTEKAFRLYVDAYFHKGMVEIDQERTIEELFNEEAKEVDMALRHAIETFSELTKCATFLSLPRFDQDFVQDVRLMQIRPQTVLAVLITDFGKVRSEILCLEQDVDDSFLKVAESYFLWRLGQGEKPSFREEGDRKLAQRLYNEVMVRHVVGYANFSNEDILRTGLSKLLAYSEFSEPSALVGSLSLLEDTEQMRALLRICCKKEEMVSWVGDELCPFVPPESECTIIAIPYRIHQTVVGAIALLGPTRLAYRNLFGLARLFSEKLSAALTKNLYKHQISFRQPASPGTAHTIIKKNQSILLEDKSR